MILWGRLGIETILQQRSVKYSVSVLVSGGQYAPHWRVHFAFPSAKDTEVAMGQVTFGFYNGVGVRYIVWGSARRLSVNKLSHRTLCTLPR